MKKTLITAILAVLINNPIITLILASLTGVFAYRWLAGPPRGSWALKGCCPGCGGTKIVAKNIPQPDDRSVFRTKCYGECGGDFVVTHTREGDVIVVRSVS